MNAIQTAQTIFVAGISGLLGLNVALTTRRRMKVVGSFSTHPVVIEGVNSVHLDLRDRMATRELFERIRPGIVLNAAGLTNVDQCESFPELAGQLNVDVAKTLAELAVDYGAKLVHVSTDHLTDGLAPLRRETDPAIALNAYARTKLEAEEAVLKANPAALLIRTNFFGWGPSYRPSFSDWILQSLDADQDISMFDDVYFTPILINDLVDRIFDCLDNDITGLHNLAGAERLSKFEFGQQLATAFGYAKSHVRPRSVNGFPFRAKRPADMSLCCTLVEQKLQRRMPTIEEGFARLRVLANEGWRSEITNAARGNSRSSTS